MKKKIYDEIDIGLMPIPRDNWLNSKGGYKLMVYMSMGKISIASDVGINRNIIMDKINGFLIKSQIEWYERVKFILDNYDNFDYLRLAARKKIVETYSLKVIGKNHLNLFNC